MDLSEVTRAQVLEWREQGLKPCRMCEQVLPLDEFHVNRRNQDGRQSRCKQCQCTARKGCYWKAPEKSAAYAREYRKEHREEDLERKRRYHAENPILERLRRGKNRAIHAGLRADHITAEELLADWERRGIDPTRDVYTGEPLVDGWHIDHMTPLSKGGAHVVNNLVPCNPGTNNNKRARGLVGYLADRVEKETA